MAREIVEEMARDAQRMNEQIARDAEIVRIHTEEELKMMIDGLDRSNKMIAKHLHEYKQATAELTIGEKIELINELVIYQDHHAKILKYSPLGDDSQGEAFPTITGLDAGQDRENIMKTSALPHDSTPRVTSLDADEGRSAKLSRDNAPIKGRSMEIGEEAGVEKSIERGSNDTEELVNVLTYMDAANILTSGVQDVSVPPVAEVSTVGVPTGSGLVPTVSAIFTTASVVTPYSRHPREISAKDKGKEKMVESDTPKKKKLQEQIDVQMAREIVEEMARDAQRMNEQIARDAEIVRIHTEEELKMMIDGLDRSNKMIAKHLHEYKQATAELTIGEKIELINELVIYQDHHAKILKYQAQQSKPLSKKEQREFYMSVLRSHSRWKTKHFKGMTLEEIREKFIPVWKQIEDFVLISSKEEGERVKRKGLKLEQGSAKKMKTSDGVSKEDLKEMMQLVPVEEVYVEALQVKHPIIDWEIHTKGKKDYWKIIRLGGHTASEHNIDFHPVVDFIEASPLRTVPLFDTILVQQGEGLGIPTESHHTPSPEVQSPSHTTHTSSTLPPVTTTSLPTVTQSDTPIDRATIAKSSTLPHDSAPRVTSPVADEGSMQQIIPELTALCTSLQRQLSELTAKFQAQEVEINRSMDEGEADTKRISDDSEEMATVLTSMDAATVLASGVVDVPTSGGSIPTTSTPTEEQVPTGSEVVPTASPIFATVTVVTPYRRRKGKEVMEYHQFALELPMKRRIELITDLVKYQDNYAKIYKYQSQQRKPMSKKQKRDYYMAVIRTNLGWKVKDFRGSKEEAERIKRKGLNLEQESVKKQKKSEEVPEEAMSVEEFPKEKITRLGGSSASYQFFIDLLKHLDREDLNQLWRLVKETLSNRPPTSEKEIELWVELNKMYEPNNEDQIQRDIHASGEGLPFEKGFDTCDDLLQASSGKLLSDRK
nr:hypothetical protein [Tanacetum cinerariifolium]